MRRVIYLRNYLFQITCVFQMEAEQVKTMSYYLLPIT